MTKKEYLNSSKEKRFDALEEFLIKEYDNYIKSKKVGMTLEDFFHKNKKVLTDKFVDNLSK